MSDEESLSFWPDIRYKSVSENRTGVTGLAIGAKPCETHHSKQLSANWQKLAE